MVELKYNQSADTAIRQIREKHYSGVLNNFAGEVLLVGVNYDKKTKIHECKIERMGDSVPSLSQVCPMPVPGGRDCGLECCEVDFGTDI